MRRLMRMWMVDPQFMCERHLTLEHGSCHLIVLALNEGEDLSSLLKDGHIEIGSLHERHEELVLEMDRRGLDHCSLLPSFESGSVGVVDRHRSALDLADICVSCEARLSVAGLLK